MADFNIASQVQPVAAPNPLNMLEHVQKMQTSNMLMQQRAAELQKENAIRGAAAQHGFGSQAYIDAVARIDPAAAALALTQQRQAEAARASAGASAASAALSRLQGDKVTQDILAKKGDQFVMGLRSLESYPPEQQPVIYGKMYQAMPDTLKPFFNPIYSPKAAELAQMTAADFVAKAKEAQPQLQPQEAGMPGRTAYMPGANGGLGTMVMVPEALPPGAVNTMTPQPGGVNNLAPNAGANFTPRPMPGVNNLAPGAAPAPVALGAQPQAGVMLPSQARVQAQAADLAKYRAQETIKKELETPKETPEEKLKYQADLQRQNARVDLEISHPAAKAVVDTVVSDIDTQIARAKELRNHSGLRYITGSLAGRTPSSRDAATSAQADLDQILANAGFEALQQIRNRSPTGGALGNVSNEEGRRLQDSAAALKQAQGTKTFQAKLDRYIADLERSKGNVKNTFDTTYAGIKPKEAQLPTGISTSGWSD
jgi:hypothetical protein